MLGFLPLRKGETKGKPYQLLFDSLIDGSLFPNQSKVSELKKSVRTCPIDGSQVSIANYCSKGCYERSRKEWVECHLCADQGTKYNHMQSGKLYKGAIK